MNTSQRYTRVHCLRKGKESTFKSAIDIYCCGSGHSLTDTVMRVVAVNEHGGGHGGGRKERC